MSEIINPMKKQTVYAEGKTAFVDGKRRVLNPYRWHNKELASIWMDGWDHARKAKEANDRILR
jgi:ribosome modulation factor